MTSYNTYTEAAKTVNTTDTADMFRRIQEKFLDIISVYKFGKNYTPSGDAFLPRYIRVDIPSGFQTEVKPVGTQSESGIWTYKYTYTLKRK